MILIKSKQRIYRLSEIIALTIFLKTTFASNEKTLLTLHPIAIELFEINLESTPYTITAKYNKTLPIQVKLLICGEDSFTNLNNRNMKRLPSIKKVVLTSI